MSKPLGSTFRRFSLKRLHCSNSFLFFYLFFISCTSNKLRTVTFYPPGVDRNIARVAFKEAENLFIPYSDEELAKIEKEKGSHLLSVFESLDSLKTQIDTLYGSSDFSNKIRGTKIDQKLRSKIEKTIKNKNINEFLNILSEEKRKTLQKANRFLEKSYILNPFDIDVILYLSRTYTHQYLEVHKESDTTNYYLKAINILNKALGMDRGGHDIYYRLADNYRAAKDWGNSVHYYKLALETLRNFEFLPENPLSNSFDAFVDTSLIYKYLYLIADSYVRLYDSDKAVQYFNDALHFTESEEIKDQIEDYIKWINWASGDIKTRENFEKAAEFEKTGKYEKAAEQYLEVIDRTRNSAKLAHWETSWRLAKIEDGFLVKNNIYIKKYGNKNIGLHRMQHIVQEIPKDSLGVPYDTVFYDYLNDFAKMLFNHATRLHKQEGEKQKAIKLFEECAVQHSNIQAKSCLQMTKFMQNSRLTGLLWALKTYSLREQLDKDELSELFVLFKRVTRRPRNPVLQKYFNEKFRYISNKTPISIINKTKNDNIKDRKTELKVYEFLRSGYQYLDNFLWKNFSVRQDSEILKMYEHLYRIKERELLSEKEREKLRKEISDFYYRTYKKPEERSIFNDWRKHLRSLR